MRWECLHAQQLQQPLPATLQQAHTIIVMPSTDLAQAQRAAELMANRAAVDDALLLVVLDDAREGFVAIANRVYRATRSQCFGYVAQDAFAGRRWLQLALHTLLQHNKGLLGFNDGKWAGALAAFGLGQRRWLDTHYGGDLFHPGYAQHYADTELTVLARGNHQYTYNPQAVLVEVDWGKDSKSVNLHDRMLFVQRKLDWLPPRVAQTASLELFS